MLISEQDERGRKFKLAIRAGLPILALISLVAYATLLQTASFNLGLRELTLGAALVFVTTYFIFFSIDEGEQKSLIDPITGSYNYASFLRHYHRSKPNALGLLLINNLGTINENYGISDIDHMLKTLIRHLNRTLTAARLQPAIIGRKQGAEFLIAVRGDERQLADAIGSFVRDHATIGEIELDYRFEPLGG
jgi:GGDEF domain-containing protein